MIEYVLKPFIRFIAKPIISLLSDLISIIIDTNDGIKKNNSNSNKK